MTSPALALRSLLEAPLQAGNYQQKFQLLLHLEEIQMEVDIRRYDMQEVTMVQDRELLVLDVSRESCCGRRGPPGWAAPGARGGPGSTLASRRPFGAGAWRG